MKKIILIFTVLAFTCLSSECIAQNVISYEVDGHTYNAVINNIALPIGAIKTKKELKDQKTNAGQMIKHNDKHAINKNVSLRFAVAKDNISKKQTWDNASTVCENYTEGSSTTTTTTTPWRVPTQRELMLMYQMKTELEAKDNFKPFFSEQYDSYWSSTRSSLSASIWCVNFTNGAVFNFNLYGDPLNNVRCIRDL